jgi:hypothetical protein
MLPLLWITRLVEASQNHDVRAVDLIEDAVGEASQQETTRFTRDNGIEEGSPSQHVRGRSEGAQKLPTEAALTIFVPARRLRELCVGFGSDL